MDTINPYLEQNVKVLESVADSYPNIREAYEKDPNGTIFHLRTMGLRCARCGKGITGPNFKFWGFEPKVFCNTCQKIHNAL